MLSIIQLLVIATRIPINKNQTIIIMLIILTARCWFLLQFTGNGRLNQVKSHRILLRMATEIAVGMHYLHESSILHRDLSSSNVLLDSQLCTKISDFGLSRPQDVEMSGIGGNLLYLSPEAFLYQQFTQAS